MVLKSLSNTTQYLQGFSQLLGTWPPANFHDSQKGSKPLQTLLAAGCGCGLCLWPLAVAVAQGLGMLELLLYDSKTQWF